MHVGLHNYASGREDEAPAINLSNSLRSLGLELGRLKTGTPPRLLRSSIDFTQLEKQPSDNLDYLFDFYPHNTTTKRDCYITHTNEKVHQIIKNHAHLSPILRKEITGTGPRYCPSIEDKITRFPNKTAHQIFVEPESLSTEWIYPNGLSTSLPLEVQQQYINAIKGFENAIITRPGYAIEYDMVMPHQLYSSLETKKIHGLFLAGQINGTTGYEEAAGQGIIAGINASLKSEGKDPFILNRNESYIGIMIDDLTTMSIDEPYRMFTSRAERRLLLRQDNSFLRLTDKAYALGLIIEEMYKDFSQEKEAIATTIQELRASNSNTDLLRLFGDNGNASMAVTETTGKILGGRPSQTIQAEIKYAPYIEREEAEAGRLKKHQQMQFPENFTFMGMEGLSTELQQKLTKIKPATLAQAGLIPGMTPAALSLLMLKISMFNRTKAQVCREQC